MSDEQRRLVETTTIPRGTVGSTVHGLHQGDQDDRDEMAIFLEPPEFLVGLRLARSGRSWGPFEYYVLALVRLHRGPPRAPHVYSRIADERVLTMLELA